MWKYTHTAPVCVYGVTVSSANNSTYGLRENSSVTPVDADRNTDTLVRKGETGVALRDKLGGQGGVSGRRG